MKEFAYGTYERFELLFDTIPVNNHKRFRNCRLPKICNQSSCDLGFGRTADKYIFSIEKGIEAECESESFLQFLKNGEAEFCNLQELVDFCNSMQPLFSDEKTQVYDKEKLREIEQEEDKLKKVYPSEISGKLKEGIYGQDNCIDELSELIVINHRSKIPKLLTVALLGKTATGKSETAKSVANVLTCVYGKEYGFIEVAGSEFIGEHTVHRFLGAPPGYLGYGQPTVLEPIRKNPYHIIVMNEVEKADDKLLVSLMEAIDTGFLGMADNSKPIDLRKSILLFTSNISMDTERYRVASEFHRSEMCRDAFTKHCKRPEISGKIGNFIVFNDLSNEAIENIIVKFVREELADFDLVLNHIETRLMYEFKKHQTKYGARGIRILVHNAIGRQLVNNRELENWSGKRVNLKGTIDNIKFLVEGLYEEEN